MALHWLDGRQYWTESEAKEAIKRGVQPKDRKYFYVVKEKRPSWYSSSDKWKQTYTVRVKDYSRIRVVSI